MAPQNLPLILVSNHPTRMQNIPATDPSVQALLLEIAKAQFPSVETLETRHMDGLDFHDCHVAAIKRALEAAFRLGQVSAS